jgi:transcriptional regulator with XRE-family HTH domain
MNDAFSAGCEARDIDRIVGERIRRARLLRGMTQDDLAEKLKLSYQQVQKYETGANRVSAGRLFQIASFLGEDVAWFYQGSPVAELPHGGSDRGTIELVKNYEALSPAMKAIVGRLAKELAGGEPEVQP